MRPADYLSVLLAILALAAVSWSARAAEPAADTSAAAVISAIGPQMEPFLKDREIAGTVTLVATPEEIVHLQASGLADIESQQPMQTDSIFWIASMTKPITGTAVMMLQDEGKLSVDDPVAKYLPEFRDLKTEDGEPAEVTIRHLLTHTSGLSELSPQQAAEAKTLADVIPIYTSRPLRFAPGSQWAYCQSGINTAARIVEVVSGQGFAEFLDERLFAPLGMRDTTFYLTDQQLQRLATSYARTPEGKLEPAEIIILHGKSPASRERFPAANGGLFSTAGDYARFCQMVLRGGEYGGRRFLSPEAVRQMTTAQTADLKVGFTPGNAWGLGWCVIRQPQGVTGMLSPGTYGHGGAYGTQAWIDPARQRVYILMVQRSNFPNSDASPVRQAFQQAAAGS